MLGKSSISAFTCIYISRVPSAFCRILISSTFGVDVSRGFLDNANCFTVYTYMCFQYTFFNVYTWASKHSKQESMTVAAEQSDKTRDHCTTSLYLKMKANSHRESELVSTTVHHCTHIHMLEGKTIHVVQVRPHPY